MGKGTWGSVCLGTVKATGRRVAVKEIHRSLERYEASKCMSLELGACMRGSETEGGGGGLGCVSH